MDKFAALDAFVQVVKANGFAAAAREMGLSRSAVNKLVISLETELGVRLLQRSTRRVMPTATGTAFYQRCLGILADLKEAELAVAQSQDEPVGPLRVNAPMTFGTMHLGPVLAEFMGQYPRVQVQLTLADRFIDPLAEGFDLTIRIAQPQASPSFVVHELATLPRLLCAAPSYLERQGCPATVQELSHHSCLAYGELTHRPAWTFVGGDGVGGDGVGENVTVPINGALCSNNGEVLRDAAVQGLGIALLPRFIVQANLENNTLQEIVLDHCSPSLSLLVVYPSNRHLSTKVQLLTAFLRQRFEPMFVSQTQADRAQADQTQ